MRITACGSEQMATRAVSHSQRRTGYAYGATHEKHRFARVMMVMNLRCVQLYILRFSSTTVLNCTTKVVHVV